MIPILKSEDNPTCRLTCNPTPFNIKSQKVNFVPMLGNSTLKCVNAPWHRCEMYIKTVTLVSQKSKLQVQPQNEQGLYTIFV